MVAGTLEMIWLKPMDQAYSWLATAFFSISAMFGFAEMEEEKIKKHRKVISST